jgi:hypothetical protein
VVINNKVRKCLPVIVKQLVVRSGAHGFDVPKKCSSQRKRSRNNSDYGAHRQSLACNKSSREGMTGLRKSWSKKKNLLHPNKNNCEYCHFTINLKLCHTRLSTSSSGSWYPDAPKCSCIRADFCKQTTQSKVSGIFGKQRQAWIATK